MLYIHELPLSRYQPTCVERFPLCCKLQVVSAESAAGPTCSSADEVDDDFSILKYEDPVLARPDIAFDMRMGHDSLPQYISLYASDERRPDGATQRLAGVGAAALGSARNTIRRPRGGGDDITAVLKAILPNKEYADVAGEWVQTVSSDNFIIFLQSNLFRESP